MPDRTKREAGRVLLVDGRDRVLLFCGVDPHRPESRPFWVTPGGGLDDGETHRDGALRELAEETGLSAITSVDLGEPVWERDCAFEFESVHYRQHEYFFLLRVAAHSVDVSGFNELERRTVKGHRWWSVDELAATDQLIYPTTLGFELELLLRDGRPSQPKLVVSDDES